MIRWLIGAGFLLVFLAIFFVMRRAWRRRGERQSSLARPLLAPEALGAALVTRDLFYVATSMGGDPLDRVVVGGLGFRGRAVVSVHPEGVVLDIAGEQPVLVPRADVIDVGRSTWTIDRVVESDGLVRLAWRLGDQPVDTYLRDSDGPRDLVDAIRSLIPTEGPRTTTQEKTS